MIRVSHLTKRYPGHLAVDDVSFEVNRGEVVGFLGPNGAGKSTTMRIITGFLPATGGEVTVGGRDVLRESREVRRRIGYLPENCPLYPEMRVDEYLRFRARLKGVQRSSLRRRLREVKELCGLSDVGRRIIGHLSKGYCQRVGLAEVLVHEPELLILDEPTIGLDPNQIRQVRDLIKQLAQQHTILLSTHILDEVEKTCERVLIINKGRIIASDTPRNLQSRLQGATQVVVELQGPRPDVQERLNGLPHVRRVDISEDGDWLLCRLECADDADPRSEIFETALQNGWKVRELRVERGSLEEVFVSLTRDGGGPPR